MSLAKSLLGYREFSSELQIRQTITKSKNYNASKEAPEHAKSLLIFETSKQHTWLVATEERLYFILDDVRKPEPHINRSVRRNTLKAQTDGSTSIQVLPKSIHTGLVDVGLGQRSYLYSKDLFSQRPIENEINAILAGTAGHAVSGEN